MLFRSQAARKVTSAKKALNGNCGGVKVMPALTPTDSSRNWALRTAEDLIRTDPVLRGREIEVKKAAGRGLYVGGKAAFLQKMRSDPKGSFENEFTHLELPE